MQKEVLKICKGFAFLIIENPVMAKTEEELGETTFKYTHNIAIHTCSTFGKRVTILHEIYHRETEKSLKQTIPFF